MCIKDQLSAYLPALLQIAHGLETCGLLETVKKYPDVWQPVFEAGNIFAIGATEFLDNLKAHNSSSQIQNLPETDCFKFFCDVVESIDRGKVSLAAHTKVIAMLPILH